MAETVDHWSMKKYAVIANDIGFSKEIILPQHRCRLHLKCAGRGEGEVEICV